MKLATLTCAIVLTGWGVAAQGMPPADVLLEHYDVFVNGETIEGLSYNTYRIPNIAQAADGTLIAVAEARLTSAADPGGTHIDLVAKRSFDGGRTWSAGFRLDRHPDAQLNSEGIPTNRTSASNSVTFVDETTGRLWVLNLRLPHATPSASTLPGVDDMQTWARSSDDHGATWSAPFHIVGNSEAIPYEDFYPNLGSATQLRSGRLIVPATEDNQTVNSRSFALFSDDGGATWQAGAQVDAGTNEAQIVELADGRLLMSARQNAGGGRKFAISTDQGATWGPTFNAFNSTAVMEAIERYTLAGSNGETVNRLLHTLPVGGPVGARTNLDILIATDELSPAGPTFGNGRRVIHGWTGYSDLANIDGDEVGVLWERGDTGHHQRITYTRLNRAFLESKGKQLGLIAHEGFDYPADQTLAHIGSPELEQGYSGGYAPVTFSGRTDLDLAFSIDLTAGGGPTTLNPGIVPNDQANGILGQLFTTGADGGGVTQIAIQRAPNGMAGPAVYLHIYKAAGLTQGLNESTFLASSLTAQSLNPTDSGTTVWEFDDSSAVLNAATQYYFAFASSPTPGELTSARAALHVSSSGGAFALGGTGFNSAWHGEVADLTGSGGATGTTIVQGNLPFAPYRLEPAGNHVQLTGGTMARGLGVGLDLAPSGEWYLSLLISRRDDQGPNDPTDEALQIALQTSDAAAQVRFGVDDQERLFLADAAGVLSTHGQSIDLNSTYLLVAKIQSPGPGREGKTISLKLFGTEEEIPDFDDHLDWTLVNQFGSELSTLLDRIEITGGGSARWSLDELRVGGDFGSVASGVRFTMLGDLNLDGVIDLTDWLAFKGNFALQTSTLSATSQLIAGDFDQNGIVDVLDLVAFRQIYDQQHGMGALAQHTFQVPESESLGLIAFGAITLRLLADRTWKECHD